MMARKGLTPKSILSCSCSEWLSSKYSWERRPSWKWRKTHGRRRLRRSMTLSFIRLERQSGWVLTYWISLPIRWLSFQSILLSRSIRRSGSRHPKLTTFLRWRSISSMGTRSWSMLMTSSIKPPFTGHVRDVTMTRSYYWLRTKLIARQPILEAPNLLCPEIERPKLWYDQIVVGESCESLEYRLLWCELNDQRQEGVDLVDQDL